MQELSANERRSQIAQMVMEKGKVLVSDLVDVFQVTETSIRRDLTILENGKRLQRVHGGAIPIPGSFRTDSFQEKQKLHMDEKERISKVAAAMVEQGHIILLDSGTTTLQIIRNIPSDLRMNNNITLVTNSMPVANEVLAWPSPNLTILGGIYLPDYQATVGPDTVTQLKALSADIAFLGTDGMTLKGGVTTANVLVSEIDRLMVERAGKAVLVSDSSKIGRAGFSPVKPISSYSTLITDVNAPGDFIEAVKDMGVEVILV